MKKNVVAFIGDAVRGVLSRSFNTPTKDDLVVSGEIIAKNQQPPDVAPSIVTTLPQRVSAEEEVGIEKRRSFASTLRSVAKGLKDGGAGEALPFFRSAFDPLYAYIEDVTYTMSFTIPQAADALEKKGNHVGNELYSHLLRVEKAVNKSFASIADSYIQNLQVMNQPLSRPSPSKPS